MKIRDYYTSENYKPDFKELESDSVGARDRLRYSATAVLEDNPRIILDIGCGDGKISKLFQNEKTYVIGVEINKRIARNAKTYIDVILADAEENWPIKDESVDAIYMGAFLEHIFDYDHILSEANRVLKKGGTLVILVPNGVSLKDRLIMLFGNQPEWYRIKGHIRFWTLPWLRKILSQHGFKEQYVMGLPFPLKTKLHKMKILNPLFRILERRFPGVCKLLLWKGQKM